MRHFPVPSLAQRGPAVSSSFCDFNMNLIKQRLPTAGSQSRYTLTKLDSAHQRRSSQCVLQGARKGLGSLTAVEGQVHKSHVTPGGMEQWQGEGRPECALTLLVPWLLGAQPHLTSERQHQGVKSQGRSLLHSPWNLEEALWSRCFPGGAEVKKSLPANAERLKKCGLDSWVGKIPWRKEWQPTPVFLPGGSHGQRSLAGYSPCNSTESDATEHARRPRQRQTLHLQEVHLMIPFLPLAQVLLE